MQYYWYLGYNGLCYHCNTRDNEERKKIYSCKRKESRLKMLKYGNTSGGTYTQTCNYLNLFSFLFLFLFGSYLTPALQSDGVD